MQRFDAEVAGTTGVASATGSIDAGRLPVSLVTGFLGSGKTTLINALLRDQAFAGSMVIVNEFGAVGLDHLLVSQGQDQVLLLDSGCLCCAASGSLRDTLIDLFARRASGAVPAFERIIVETSGLANPMPLVATLLGDSALTPRCRLTQVLTLIDASTAAETLAAHAEARQQAALADRLLITKIERVPVDGPAALYARLRELNPHAPIDVRRLGDDASRHFEPPPQAVPKTLAATIERAAAGRVVAAAAGSSGFFAYGPLRAQYGPADDRVPSPARVDASDAPPSPGAPGNASHGPARARITTDTWRIPQTLDWSAYAAWIHMLRARFGSRLLRCKGLLAIETPHAPSVVQGVQGFFAPPERLSAWPPGVDEGFIVCIGESLPRDELSACMALLDAVR